MTADEIYQMVESIGLPFAYHHFAEGEAPACPYLLYLYPQSMHFAADDRAYTKGTVLQIELYDERRDLSVERLVEDALDAADLFYRKEEVYIESEKLYEVIYEMEVMDVG